MNIEVRGSLNVLIIVSLGIDRQCVSQSNIDIC